MTRQVNCMEIISPVFLERKKKNISLTANKHSGTRILYQLFQSNTNRIDGRISSLTCRAQLKWRHQAEKTYILLTTEQIKTIRKKLLRLSGQLEQKARAS